MDELQFEWDERNIRHMMLESPRGITPDLVERLKDNEPKFFRETRPDRSGTHLMVAPDDSGRFWTIVLLDKGENVWRPITGWPSTNSQIRRYREESDD